MTCARLWQRISHLPRRLLREGLFYYDLVRLWLYNRLGSAPLTRPGNPVVSMTTWSKRAGTAYLAIESIATGRMRPSRIILWIDEADLFRNLPQTLRRLQKRGLEVRFCENYGPHKKYYPYVASEEDFAAPLVTADDDILYPRDWLERLARAGQDFPDVVNCWWGHRVAFAGNKLDKWRNWAIYADPEPSFCNIGLGGMGVLYPSQVLRAAKRSGTSFNQSASKTDDIWLHVHAIRAGCRIRQIFPRPPYLTIIRHIPGTQRNCLEITNVRGGGNDDAVRDTYTEEDIAAIRSDYCVAQSLL